jgi:hypothetical protein
MCAYCAQRVAAGDKQIRAKFDTQPFVVDLFKARPRGRKSARVENIHGESLGALALFVETINSA